MLNRLLTTIRPSHLDGVQGAGEQRSKPYMKYGAQAAQPATPQSAKSPPRRTVRRSERGMTSIVVVFVLVTLLTLIGIGFTKVMNRSLQSSAASQQASAANYAAQSGVNDVLSYLKTNPATAATKCDDLIKTGGPLASAAKISSDGNTAYTCVLVDPNPTSLFYQGLAPYKSQIVKITTSATLSSLLFSWQSTNRQHNQFVPTASGQTFYDEKTWSDKNYAPPLRLTLYPIPASGDLSGVQAGSKTFFLYPQTSGSNTLAYAAAGDTAAVNCSSKNIGSFAGSADYDCNLVINNLPSASYFYARFAPYYDQAVVKIKGNDGSSQAVQFKNVQSVVDVTAKSGGSTKRLQARVDTSSASGGVDLNISAGSDNAPEFALGSSDTICKRLIVPPSGLNPVTTDPGSATNCPFNLYGAPTVSITASPPTIASGGSSTLTWTTTNADKCTASGDWSGSQSPNNISPGVSTGPLSGPKTYTYTLTCDGPGGSGNNSATVTVNAPPPPPCTDPAATNFGGPLPCTYPPPPPPSKPICPTPTVHDDGTYFPSGDVWGNCTNIDYRVYSAHFQLTDLAGNSCGETAWVTHPSSTFSYNNHVSHVKMQGKVIGFNANYPLGIPSEESAWASLSTSGAAGTACAAPNPPPTPPTPPVVPPTPPGGGGGCGLLNTPFYPDFGVMKLYFGQVCF